MFCKFFWCTAIFHLAVLRRHLQLQSEESRRCERHVTKRCPDLINFNLIFKFIRTCPRSYDRRVKCPRVVVGRLCRHPSTTHPSFTPKAQAKILILNASVLEKLDTPVPNLDWSKQHWTRTALEWESAWVELEWVPNVHQRPGPEKARRK